jgi:hypothetical protein
MYVPTLNIIINDLNLTPIDANILISHMKQNDVYVSLHFACILMNGIGIKDLKPEYPSFKNLDISHYQYVDIGDKDKRTLFHTGIMFMIFSVNEVIGALNYIEPIEQK